VLTPRWQAPDEPAHYNYIAHIARQLALPVLQMGDYDQSRLDRLLASRFAPQFSTSDMRYESYQPPLYYLVATPVFWLTGGSLLALRLFGVLLGIGTIGLLYLCLELVFPGKTLIPLGAAAFTALLPMHIAMAAAVNNDGLAELLLMAAMLVLLRWMRVRFYAGDAVGRLQRRDTRRARHHLVMLGFLIGLGLLTKIYAYLLLPIAVLVVIVVSWLRPRVERATLEAVHLAPARRSLLQGLHWAGWVVAPAVLLALPIWVRNLLLYGPWDFLGLAWHDRVVVGQPRTGDWIADYGWVAYGERAFGFTFKSFWGVFGWMSVFLDDRIYTALLLFTGVVFLGVLWATVRFISGGPDTDMDVFQLSVLILFGLMLLAVGVSYLAYNLKFVQHQGRYFFWGLLPISTVVALGWREVLQPLQGIITGFLALVLAGAMALSAAVTGSLDRWTLLSIGVIALVLLLQPLLLAGSGKYGLRWVPARIKQWMARPRVAALLTVGRACLWVLPFVLLFVLDVAIPKLFIAPQLGG
jgi:4-amino-4-deoxy-L-arabinose transferase-like glycosyltransferase